MRKIALGKSGVQVSAIGLGCVGMSAAYGAADEQQSLETLQVTLEQGVNFLDTADLYGIGHNESLLGKFIRSVQRDDVIIATKFGSLPAGSDGLPGVDNTPEHIRSACEASLKRLNVEVIDLYYMHRRDPKIPISDSVGAMSRLVEAGKVRALGLSEVSAHTLREAHAIHPIGALQSEYSLWFRDPEDDVLPVCEELGITFVPFSPLGRGFLAGTVKEDDFSARDIRKTLPRFQGDALAKNAFLVDRLSDFAKPREATSAQIALAWLLAKNQGNRLIVPIPGTKRSNYVVENAAAANIKLSTAEVALLEVIFARDAVAGKRYSEVEARRAGT